MQSLARDSRRLLPRSLARLIAEREEKILEEVWRFPPELGRTLGADLSSGRLQPETLAALDARGVEALSLLREKRAGEGIVRLGSLLRIPADLSDPVLAAGPEGYPPGVAREYYAFIEANLSKIPVVLQEPSALQLDHAALADFWQKTLDRSRSQSAVIRSELFQNGRVVDHSLIDYRSPVFGVAALSYSRAVTAIAATWLALWREAHGDLTRTPTPTKVYPRDNPTSRARNLEPMPVGGTQ